MYDVCEGERFRVSCPHHSTLEDSSPVTVSNINMSSQSHKHMVQRNSLDRCIAAVTLQISVHWD